MAQGNVCRKMLQVKGRRMIDMDVDRQGIFQWWEKECRHSVLERITVDESVMQSSLHTSIQVGMFGTPGNMKISPIPIHAEGRNLIHFSFHSADVATAVHTLLLGGGKHRLQHG